MTERYFLPEIPNDEGDIAGGEWHHLSRVMRLRAGDRIVLFDGNGVEADAEIVTLGKKNGTVRIIQRRSDAPEPGPEIVLATAVPKSERFRWLVEKATELGVDRLVPLQTARSVADPRQTRIEKMRVTVIEACKQCRRNRLMAIDEPVSWDAFVKNMAPHRTTLVADPAGQPITGVLDAVAAAERVVAVVGPEGGLTETELAEIVEAGATRVTLGKGILRIETAALSLAAVLAVHKAVRNVAANSPKDS